MAQLPITTIPPFTNTNILPLCATMCGPLQDVNGACVPPGGPSGSPAQYTSCFCKDPRISAFSTGTLGVCDTVCTAGGLESIADWFQSICHVTAQVSSATSTQSSATSSSSGSSDSTGDSTGKKATSGSWMSNHWKWVVMLVVLVVGIAVIWIGACIWRRAYLRKKDRQNLLGQKHSGTPTNPSWGPNGENSFGMTGNVRDSARSNLPFVSSEGTPVSAFDEEKPTRSDKVKRMFS